MSEHDREPLRPVSVSRMAELEEAVTTYESALTADEARWLLARGLDEAEVTTARVGVVTDPLPGHERFRGMLAIPYLTVDCAPLTIRFRCIAEHNHRDFKHGKYMSLADDPPRMYNVGAVHRADDELHIAEGEFDGLILQKCGLHAVAIPGAQNWMPHHRRMVAGFSKVWIWGDPDEAGSDFVNKIRKGVRSAVGVRLNRTDGDVTDIYKAGGRSAVLAKIAGGGV